MKWISASKGIRYREHETRKHGKRMDRYWVLTYKLNGKTVTEAVGWWSEGHSQEEAEGILTALRRNWRTGEGPQTLGEMRGENTARRREETEKNISLADYWAGYYAPYAQQEKRPETWRGEEKGFRIWLSPRLGGQPLRTIHPRNLEAIRQEMREAGKSPRTIQHVFSTFRAVWQHARKWGVTEGECPAKGVELGRIDNARTRFLSPAELQNLLAEVKRRDSNAWEFVLAAAHTGARLGELASLTWGCINMEARAMTLIHTKTGKPRALPMTPQLAAMLDEKVPGGPSDLVFHNSEGGKWKLMPAAFRKSLAALGLNDGRTDRREIICFHSLRHTAASLMLAAGVDTRTIMELFGWSTLAMLQRYTHPGNEAKARAVAALGAAVEAKAGKVVELAIAKKKSGGDK